MIFKEPGEQITFSVSFIDDGAYFDPYNVADIEVYSPSDVLLTTITPAHPSLGHYTGVYTIPADAVVGVYTHRWKWTALEGMAVCSQDYHFSVSELVSPTLNLTKITETEGVYDPLNKEIVWSVCTGTNTVPNKNLVYSTIHKHFYFDDQPAKVWQIDAISADQPKLIGAGGLNHENDIYWRDSDEADFGTGNISEAWKSADWNLGDPTGLKNLAFLHLYARSKAVAQVLTVSWYLDGKNTAEGSATFSLTTTWTEYHLPLNGICRELAVEISNEDRGGFVQFIPLAIEFYSMTTLRR